MPSDLLRGLEGGYPVSGNGNRLSHERIAGSRKARRLHRSPCAGRRHSQSCCLLDALSHFTEERTGALREEPAEVLL